MFVDQKISSVTAKQEATFNQRLALFGLGFALLLVHVIHPQLGIALPTLLVVVPAFLVLLARSQSLKRHKTRLEALSGIHHRSAAHSCGKSTEKWTHANHHAAIVKNMSLSAQNLSRDLDIAGPDSVLSGFDETFTEQGAFALLHRCLEPKLELAVVHSNQDEIRGLSKLPGLAVKFLVYGQSVFRSDTGPLNGLEHSLEQQLSSPIYESKFRHLPGVLLLLWFVALGLLLASDKNPELSKYAAIFPVLSVFSLGLLNKGFHELIGLSAQLESLIPIVSQVEKIQVSLKKPSEDTGSWLKAVRALNRALGFLSVNSHPLVVILLNLIFPWNWLASFWAEKNRAKINQKTAPILKIMHHLEAACSLALASNRKGYQFPEVLPGDKIEFEELHHPNQNPQSFVANSFRFPSDKTVILITGSNMSGKSTFLRTLGVAQILALAGCAVPCQFFKTGLFRPLTCLRVSDSLRDGASYFYAEVQRLKWVLDELKAGSLSLVLVDEIFRGTNNRERLLGSHAYVRALLRERAKSFVTTHDLELTAIENEEKSLTNMHFSDKVSQGKMTFDYKIRPGASPTTNALKIMAMVGLPVEVPT